MHRRADRRLRGRLLLPLRRRELLLSRLPEGPVDDGTAVFGDREKEASEAGKREKMRENWG